MPWCPNCESEYDDHVKRCKQCDLDLVESLEEIVHYEKLVEVEQEELEGAIEYLRYSGIEDVQTEEIEDHIDILVNRDDFKKALKHIKVYFYNKQLEKAEAEEETPDPIIEKGYATDTTKNASRVKEMHSSATSFIGIGGILLVFGILDLVGVLKVLDVGIYLYGVIVIGAAFCLIGYLTLKNIPVVEAEISKHDSQLDKMVSWYVGQHNLTSFYADKGIDVTGLDEGALYYAAIDVIKEDLKGQFPEEDELIINGAAEEIFGKI